MPVLFPPGRRRPGRQSAVCRRGWCRMTRGPISIFPLLRWNRRMSQETDALNLLTEIIARARRAGADAADAVLVEGASIAHAQRLGKTEKLERSESYDLGLRVLFGKRQAIVSSNDRSAAALGELVERAIAMARVVPEDPYCGIAEPSEVARERSEEHTS